MKAEIIAVGSELLLGQIVNTNAYFMSKELAKLGIDVYVQTVVGDNANRLTEALDLAKERSDLIILSGGLGPTKDDLTKETVASICQKELVYDEAALTSILGFFEKRNRTMTENNKKQALVVEGSTVLTNHFGMAPGMVVSLSDCLIALLPGPPKEMEPMFMNELRPLLERKLQRKSAITSRVLRFFNIGESKLETELDDLIAKQTNPTIAPLAGEGEVTIRLTVKHEDANEAKRLLDETESEINERVGEFLYGYDDTTLIGQLSHELQQTQTTIAAAESLTGGLFASSLTDYPGTSSVFKGGSIVYSNQAKEEVLGIPNEVIEQFGVVSEECAKEMALAVKQTFHADIGISFTGVAGPSAQEGKEPGLVYIGIVDKHEHYHGYTLNLHGSRQAIRERTIKYGSFYLLNEMKRWNLTE